MKGAWISPTQEIHWTSNIQSHSKVIQELGIREYLEEEGKKLSWTEDEKKMYFDSDLAYIAMKLGYIRITNFKGEFGIEFGKESSLKDSKYEIFEVIETLQKENNEDDIRITIEKFMSTNFESYYSLKDLRQKLNS